MNQVVSTFVFCDEGWDIVVVMFPVLCGNGIWVGSGGSGGSIVADQVVGGGGSNVKCCHLEVQDSGALLCLEGDCFW